MHLAYQPGRRHRISEEHSEEYTEGNAAMIMNRLKRDWAGRAGMAAAAVFLSGVLLYLGIRGFAD